MHSRAPPKAGPRGFTGRVPSETHVCYHKDRKLCGLPGGRACRVCGNREGVGQCPAMEWHTDGRAGGQEPSATQCTLYNSKGESKLVLGDRAPRGATAVPHFFECHLFSSALVKLSPGPGHALAVTDLSTE